MVDLDVVGGRSKVVDRESAVAARAGRTRATGRDFAHDDVRVYQHGACGVGNRASECRCRRLRGGRTRQEQHSDHAELDEPQLPSKHRSCFFPAANGRRTQKTSAFS